MNGAVLLLVGALYFALAYRFYGRYLVKLFKVDPTRETPAVTLQDDVDYVPASGPVLFGHHFASIAGAGPILGPVLALQYGWVPVVVWIFIGCVFVGGVHDFAALFLSVRNGGRSIGQLIEDHIGFSGRQIFLLFCWAALVLVVSVFAFHVANTFIDKPAVATASLLFIGMAPVFGYLCHSKRVSVGAASLVFVPLLFAAVWVGTKLPFNIAEWLCLSVGEARVVWMVFLLGYVFVASVIPVWLLLQPRDYLNSYLLLSMIVLGFIGIVVAAPTLEAPKLVGETTGKGILDMFPLLFVTVACGAVSGFHALVSSGTTSKQIRSEKHILPIGYGGMLVEGLVAIMAVISVAYLSTEEFAVVMKAAGPIKAFAAGLAHFAGQIGIDEGIGETFFAMAISAFLLTTLDTATRLTRFVWQELFLVQKEGHKNHAVCEFLSNRFVATFVVVGAAGYMALHEKTGSIWPVFGASNQLLAALTLLVITIVLIHKRGNFWMTLIPMVFMAVICVWALIELLIENLKPYQSGEPENVCWLLVGAIAFLLIMAATLVVQAIISLTKAKKKVA